MTFIEEFLVWYGPWAMFLALLPALTLNAFLFQRAFRQKWATAFIASILNTVLMFLVAAGLAVALWSPMGCAGLLVALLLICGYAVVRQRRSGKEMGLILQAWAIGPVSWVLTVCLLIGGLWLGGQFCSYQFHRALAARVPVGFTEVDVRRRVKDMSLTWQEVRIPAVGGIDLLTADENGVWVVGGAVVRLDNNGNATRRWGSDEGLPSGYSLIAFKVTRDNLWYVTDRAAARLRRGSARWEVCFEAGKASGIAGFVATDADAWLYADGYRLREEHPIVDYGLFHFDSRTDRWQPVWNDWEKGLSGPVLINGEVWVSAGRHLRRYGPGGLMRKVTLDDTGLVGQSQGAYFQLGRELMGSPFSAWVVWSSNKETAPLMSNDMWGGVSRIDATEGKFSPSVCTYLYTDFDVIPDFVNHLTYLPLQGPIDWVVSARQSVWFGGGRTLSFGQRERTNAVLRYDVAKRRWTMFRGPVGPAAASSDGLEIWIAGQNSLYRCRLKDDTWQRAALPLPAQPLIAVAGPRVWVAAKDESRVWSAKVK